MARAPTAQKLWDVLTTLRTALDAERTGGSEWLSGANEVRIGIQAREQSYHPNGIYLLPETVRLTTPDTETFRADPFIIKAVCVVRSLSADADANNPATLQLLDLVGGVIQVARAERAGGLSGKALLIPQESTDVPFNIIPPDREGGLFEYEAPVMIHCIVEV